VATLPGQRARSTLPPADTPGGFHPAPDALSRAAAEAAWRSVTPSIAATPHVRVSRDGGRTFPARHARPLPDGPPGQPATVAVYDPGSATGRMLALDLDPSRIRLSAGADDRAVQDGHEHRADPAAGVAAQAASIAGLVARCGGQVLADVSPSGGRHVFILFAAALPWRELRDLARAIALRFPAVDPAPMSSMGAQISPPGSRHKSGGWRLLSTPLSEARAAAEHPNGPGVWSALLTEFAAELQVSAARPATPDQAGAVCLNAELDDSGAPWIPRLGGRAPLGAGLDQAARTGRWDRSRYPDRSAARMAVLAAAAARGWQLADVRAAIGSGAWRGLARLYERPSEPGRLDRLLPYEWRKAVVFAGGEKNVRDWLTSVSTSRPPVPTGGADEFGLIRQWVTGTACAAADPDRVRRWGRRAVAVRQVLAAIGQAAMVSGSSVLEFGTRNLSLHSGLSQRTVSRLLAMLYAEPDPLFDVVTRGRMARADRFALRIPDAYAESVRWRRRRAGRIDGVHPVFLVLGGAAGLVHQVLDGTEARGAEVARAARLSPSATSAALRALAEHGLAERSRCGWRRGAAYLDDVAESTGAAAVHRERAERYRRDRESWRARLRQYQAARHRPVNERDGWWSLDDPDEYDFAACRWPVLSGDPVRGPPSLAAAAQTA
jgi:DNA-binding transcriptional ArsR family regulator